MQTLYDVLGLSRQATLLQIEDAFHQKLKSLSDDINGVFEEKNAIQTKALKEAYSILSSTKRRQSYDASLRHKEQVRYHIVEETPTPWIKIICGLIVLVVCFLFYNQQQNNAEREQKALEVRKAQAEAEEAEQLALADETRIEELRLNTKRDTDLRQRQEIEKAIYEGNIISERNRRHDEQNARDKQRDEQSKMADNERAERDARAKRAAEEAAMRRAFTTPVGRQNYSGSNSGGTIQSK